MCVVCKQDLFPSESKYDSKCGWPAFFDTVDSSCVKYKQDLSHGKHLTNLMCVSFKYRSYKFHRLSALLGLILTLLTSLFLSLDEFK